MLSSWSAADGPDKVAASLGAEGAEADASWCLTAIESPRVTQAVAAEPVAARQDHSSVRQLASRMDPKRSLTPIVEPVRFSGTQGDPKVLKSPTRV